MALVYYLLIPPLLLYILLGFNPLRLLQNYLSARHTNLPLLLSPPNPAHIPWTILGIPLRPYLKRYLPDTFSLFTRLNMSTYGFEFTSRNTAHARLGSSFVLVTSGQNELNIADPDLAWEVLRRPKEFRQTLIGSKVMRIFGDNLITSDGEHWARQRKLIASNINERISETVFAESVRQTNEMMQTYSGDADGKSGWGRGETNDYADGLKSVAINVLGVAGYGVQRSWKESREEQEPLEGFKLTYIEATRLAIDHIVECSLLPAWVFLLGFMPEPVKRLGYAIKEFPAHTKNMLDRERREPSGKINMMNMLVKESDSHVKGDVGEKGDDEKDGKGSVGLTEDEIMGNLFVFTAAGFDTTANTMGYAMTLLACYPKWQHWMCQEIDEVLEGKKNEDFEYSEVFPRLVRVLAVMYETLRLFPAVVHIAKGTSPDLKEPVVLTHPITGTQHHIPANTIIYINNIAIQNNPDIYGDDVDDFRPDRFIDISGDKGKPSIKSFGKGTFLAWSGGPRVCPGMKMSQVEFVAVFMSIFSKYTVEIVRKGVGEYKEAVGEARARVEGLMADSQSRLTLQMNQPKEVKIRFISRGR